MILGKLSNNAKSILLIILMVLVVMLFSIQMVVIRDLQARDQARQESSRKQDQVLEAIACGSDVTTESAGSLAEFLNSLPNAEEQAAQNPKLKDALKRLRENAERARALPRQCPYPPGSGPAVAGPPK